MITSRSLSPRSRLCLLYLTHFQIDNNAGVAPAAAPAASAPTMNIGSIGGMPAAPSAAADNTGLLGDIFGAAGGAGIGGIPAGNGYVAPQQVRLILATPC